MSVCAKRTVIRVCAALTRVRATFAVQNPVFLYDRNHEIPLRRTLEHLFVRKKPSPQSTETELGIWMQKHKSSNKFYLGTQPAAKQNEKNAGYADLYVAGVIPVFF